MSTNEEIEAKIASIESDLKDAEKTAKEIHREWSKADARVVELQVQIRDLRAALAEQEMPFKKGDVVADDEGVRYRVHRVYRVGEWVGRPMSYGSGYAQAPVVFGIRLTKTGNEAYAKPREIVAKSLTLEA